MGTSPTSPEAIIRAEKKRKAVQMRTAGLPYRVIAQELDVDERTAQRYVQQAVKDTPRDAADELRQMQLDRLNFQLAIVWPTSTVTNHVKCEEVLGIPWPGCQIEHERARSEVRTIMREINNLEGLDAAKKVDVTQTQVSGVLVIDGEGDDYIRRLKQMAGAEPLADGDLQDPESLTPAGKLKALDVGEVD